MNDWLWQATPFHSLLTPTPLSFGSTSRQSGNQDGGDSEESSLRYVYYLLAGREEEEEEAKTWTRLQERNKDSSLWQFPKLHCNNQPLGNTAFDIQESCSTAALAVRWRSVQWKSPSSEINEIWFYHCCIHSKVVHLSKVFTSKADNCTSV